MACETAVAYSTAALARVWEETIAAAVVVVVFFGTLRKALVACGPSGCIMNHVCKWNFLEGGRSLGYVDEGGNGPAGAGGGVTLQVGGEAGDAYYFFAVVDLVDAKAGLFEHWKWWLWQIMLHIMWIEERQPATDLDRQSVVRCGV